MKTDEEIVREGWEIGSGDSYYRDGIVIYHNGYLYPFRGGKMVNPLDPMNIILCMEIIKEFDSKDSKFIRQVCDTVLKANEIRKAGYSIITRYKSGAPKAVLDSTNNVIILGELAKSNKLILPILSTQLSDGSYDQSSIAVWKERGFRTPAKYTAEFSHSEWSGDSGEFGQDYTSRTSDSYTIGDYIVSFVEEEKTVTEINDSDGPDLDYSGWSRSFVTIERAVESSLSKTERPEFVWQDRGVDDED